MKDLLVFLKYGDNYVESRIREAFLKFASSINVQFTEKIPSSYRGAILQWAAYEELDFNLLQNTSECLYCSYVIRKAVIRKHHLPVTASYFLSKNPNSILKRAIPETVSFEIDFAEFLDEALVDAFELRDSLEENDLKNPNERHWWILKAGMADRGNGIRLFSTEDQLRSIFEEWEESEGSCEDEDDNTGLVTNHLRHFVAQKYVHPPLLLENGKKFHIRTYVLVVGSMKVFVFKQMLALFAGRTYTPPWDVEVDGLEAHLTNTCLQGHGGSDSVKLFWDLSLPKTQLCQIFSEILEITGDLFEAAAKEQRIHFQVFGVDFLVDSAAKTHLLEVNAYPDFKQTGDEFGQVIQQLFDDVLREAVMPFFGLQSEASQSMVLAREVDMSNWL